MNSPFEIIRDPGKFEGELSPVPKMWELALEGVSDVDVTVDGITYWFVPLEEVADVEGPDYAYGAALYEDSNGFVHSIWYDTAEEYSAAILRLERDADDWGV